MNSERMKKLFINITFLLASICLYGQSVIQTMIDENGTISQEEELPQILEKPYFPWMFYVISEAKAMNGTSECDEPLFSKGKEYHSI